MADLNKNIDTSKTAGVVLVILTIIGGYVYWNNANKDGGTPILPPTQVVSELQQATSPQTDLKVGKTSEATDDFGNKHIYADVINSGEAKKGVSLTATLYDANSVVIGVVYGAALNIGKGETKAAEFIVTDSK